MRVNQLANTLNVTSDTVRYYTRLGILHPKKNPINGYKEYCEQDARRLHFTLRAKQLGFSLNDIKKIIEMADKGTTPCPIVRDILQENLTIVQKSLQECQQLVERMHQAMMNWEEMPDSEPNGHTICQLIENWDTTFPMNKKGLEDEC